MTGSSKRKGDAAERDYAERLEDFIIAHIGRLYSAEECGHILEVRQNLETATPNPSSDASEVDG